MQSRAKKIILLFLSCAFLFVAKNAFALENRYPTIFGVALNDTSNLPEFGKYVFTFLIALTIFISVCAAAYGGLNYIYSFGRGQFKDNGKDWIKAGLLGLFISVSSYALAYTINPALVVFDLGNIFGQTAPNNPNPKLPVGMQIQTYQEVPAGILVENVLSKTMDCYAFDPSGNPIAGAELQPDSGSNVLGPTFLEHDRINCLFQLTEGAAKKGQVVAELSNEIIGLMRKCDCDKYGDCRSVCKPDTGCLLVKNNEPEGKNAECVGDGFNNLNFQQVDALCKGDCKKGPCKVSPDKKEADCCPKDSGVKDPNKRNRNLTVKEQIESGPINLGCPEIQGPVTNLDPGFDDPNFGGMSDSPSTECKVKTFSETRNIKEPGKGKIKTAMDITVSPDVDLAAVKWAVDQWNAVMPYPVFGNVTAGGGGSGGGVIMQDDLPTPPGWTTPMFGLENNSYDSSGYLSSFTITLNTNTKTYPPDMLRMGLLHELGHAIGLDDSYDTNAGKTDPTCFGLSVMDYQYSMNGPGPADLTAINALYGTSSFLNNNNNKTASLLNAVLAAAPLANAAAAPAAGPVAGCGCTSSTISYRGLDEFRSMFNGDYGQIKNFVEQQVTVNKKQITVMKGFTDCGVCDDCLSFDCNGDLKQCYKEKDFATCLSIYGKCVKKFTKCISDSEKCEKTRKECLKNIPWYQLPLIDQLTYFNGKIEELKLKIQKDNGQLSAAANMLQSGKCYVQSSYVDLLKTYQKNNQSQKIIFTQKIFSDTNSESGAKISISNYCSGFNYANSACLKKCNDACPDYSWKAILLYQDCASETNKQACIKNAYLKRPCVYGTDSSSTFSSCMESCQTGCVNLCAKKYPSCSDDFNLCKNMCQSDSRCVLDNSSKCLIDTNLFVQCADSSTDEGNAKFCYKNAYLCKNGSDQNAGYPDCVDLKKTQQESALTGDMNESANDKCPPNSFDATDFFEHPECEKCLHPLSPASAGSCAGDASSTCQDLCPQTAKCPPASKCATCPCDQIDNKTITYSVPKRISWNPITEHYTNTTPVSYQEQQVRIAEYQMVGPQCNEKSYNDDPLTFYCQSNWWEDDSREGRAEKPIGNDKICSKSSEVPSGQTIDDTLKYGFDLTTKLFIMQRNIISMIGKMDMIGKAKDTINPPISNYCKCNAQYEQPDANGRSAVCATDCKYHQEEKFDADANGNPIPNGWDCQCNFVKCKGQPCQQVIDYLSELWNFYRDFKKDYSNFSADMLKENRSDLFKELEYSRKKTNECSVASKNYGIDERLFPCTWLEDQIVSPIITGEVQTIDGKNIPHYCYGTNLGKITNQKLTDNWFCCQQWAENTSASEQNKQ